MKTETRTRKFATLVAALAIIATAVPAPADELELPTASEVQYFSPEAQQFYAAGVAALDKVDYVNAYAMIAKAASLQPAAIRLNHITATLAIYHGRQNAAEEARDFYETALNSYQNILRIPTISGDFRRQIINEMKLAEQERDNLAQRDVIREASGTTFFMEYNRLYAERPARAAGAPAAATPATTITQQMLSPLMQPQYPNQGGVMPGMVPGMDAGMPGMMPGQPGMMPGQPGMMPGQPGMMPGQPGMQPGPGMPNNQPLV
jgi:hypothetical protein